MSKRSAKATVGRIILPGGGNAPRAEVSVPIEEGPELGRDEEVVEDPFEGFEGSEPSRGKCPGCLERPTGAYCIEVDPGVMWRVPSTLLNPKGPQIAVERYHLPVWLCKVCFDKMYARAAVMVHEMVKYVPVEKPEKKS